MHLIFGTRGVQHMVDMWHTHMQSIAMPFPRKNLDVCECGRTLKEHEGKEAVCKDFKPRPEDLIVQGALRPIQMWEYVFPKDQLNLVLNTLNIKPKGLTQPEGMNKYAALMRKAMKLKPIPDEIPDTPKIPLVSVHAKHIHFFPIGIKEDIIEDCDFKKEGRWFQERL